MDFSAFIPDILSGLITNIIFAVLAYVVAYLPISRRVKVIEKQLHEYNSKINDEIYDIYQDRLSDLKKERQWHLEKRVIDRSKLDDIELNTQHYSGIEKLINDHNLSIKQVDKQIDEIIRLITDIFETNK